MANNDNNINNDNNNDNNNNTFYVDRKYHRNDRGNKYVLKR